MTKTAEYWKQWLKAAGVRAIKTVAQTAVATIGSSAALGDVHWAWSPAPPRWPASSRC